MANALYSKARQKFAIGGIAWDTDQIRCLIVDTGYYSCAIDTDEFYSDIPVDARITSPITLSTSIDAETGIPGADGVSFNNVTSSGTIALVIYKNTGDAATSPLIAYMDTGDGFPTTPSSQTIQVSWFDGVFEI